MVEMAHFQMGKFENLINGTFTLSNYDLTQVTFKVQGNKIYFESYNGVISSDPLKREKGKAIFDLWHETEKEEYTTYIQNYLNEIRKLDSHYEFKGEIVQENREPSLNLDTTYNIHVKYKHFLHDFKFIFIENNMYNNILCQIHLPINSNNELVRPIYLSNFIKEETIKRMWEPFRNKTKYRLQLLHTLR